MFVYQMWPQMKPNYIIIIIIIIMINIIWAIILNKCCRPLLWK